MVHALLISGEAGLGKWTLATALAAMLLCQEQDQSPCGHCRACLQMENLEHPDLVVLQKGVPISPDVKKPKSTIPVDDIREMIRLTSVHALEGDRHVVLIRHAEDLGREAQNALLKTLEEPPEGVFFLLTSIRTHELLPTIISRCRPLKLHPWGDDEVIRVLLERGIPNSRARQAAAAASGSFGTAIRISEDEEYWQFRDEVLQDFMNCPSRSDILRNSSRWKDRKEDADAVFTILEGVLHQLMQQTYHLAEAVPEDLCPRAWQKFASRAETADYIKLLDGILLARKRVASAVNFQAVVEQVILMLMEAVHS